MSIDLRDRAIVICKRTEMTVQVHSITKRGRSNSSEDFSKFVSMSCNSSALVSVSKLSVPSVYTVRRENKSGSVSPLLS